LELELLDLLTLFPPARALPLSFGLEDPDPDRAVPPLLLVVPLDFGLAEDMIASFGYLLKNQWNCDFRQKPRLPYSPK